MDDTNLNVVRPRRTVPTGVSDLAFDDGVSKNIAVQEFSRGSDAHTAAHRIEMKPTDVFDADACMPPIIPLPAHDNDVFGHSKKRKPRRRQRGSFRSVGLGLYGGAFLFAPR